MTTAHRINDHPVSKAGVILCRDLVNSDTSVASRLRNREAVNAVMYQSFVIAARRTLDHGSDVARALANWLESAGIFGGSTDIAGLAGRVDGSSRGPAGVVVSSRRVLRCLLDAAIQSVDADHRAVELNWLVASAEDRVERLRRARKTRSRAARSVDRPVSPGPELTSAIETVAASSVRAIIRFDSDRMRSAPDQDVFPFIDKLFGSAIQKWIAPGNSVGRATSLVANLEGLAWLPPGRPEQIEALLLHELDADHAPSTMGEVAVLHAKIALITGLVERHGMYDVELDRWLAMTEREVEASGTVLTRW